MMVPPTPAGGACFDLFPDLYNEIRDADQRAHADNAGQYVDHVYQSFHVLNTATI